MLPSQHQHSWILEWYKCIFTSTMLFCDSQCTAYYAYNNYAHAMRLIDSFFFTLLLSPSSWSIHRSCRPNNAPPRVSICAFCTFVYRRFVCACVRIYRGERRGGFRREKHHRTKCDGSEERKEQENCLSSSLLLLLSLSFSFSRTCTCEHTTRRTMHKGNKMREKRISCCVLGCVCICPSLLSPPSHAREREYLLRRHR